MRAKDIMRSNVISVKQEDRIEDIVSTLMKNHISGVPVTNQQNQVIGIVTEKDLITRDRGLNISSYMEFVASILFIDGKLQKELHHKIEAQTANDIMSSPVYAVYLDTTLEEVASVMINRRINRIPVINKNNELLGIIGRSDLLPTLINK